MNSAGHQALASGYNTPREWTFVRLFVQKNVMAKCSLRVHKTRFGLQSYTIKTNLQTKSITYAANFYLLSLA